MERVYVSANQHFLFSLINVRLGSTIHGNVSDIPTLFVTRQKNVFFERDVENDRRYKNKRKKNRMT